MPAPLLPRAEVVQRLFQTFRTYGYEGATLARLSEATGLGRASLYHYFPDGKEGMAREVLALAMDWVKASVLGPLREPGVASPIRLRRALKNIAAGYDDGKASCLVNVFGIGDAARVAPDGLREAADLYAQGFERLLTEAGISSGRARELALDTVITIEGALVMSRALGDRAIFIKRLNKIEKQYLDLLK